MLSRMTRGDSDSLPQNKALGDLAQVSHRAQSEAAQSEYLEQAVEPGC